MKSGGHEERKRMWREEKRKSLEMMPDCEERRSLRVWDDRRLENMKTEAKSGEDEERRR